MKPKQNHATDPSGMDVWCSRKPQMLDTYGIIKELRQPQARHIDAARNLLYHTRARPIGLWLSKQHHSTVAAGFLRVKRGRDG